jgi:hypothetical protein
MVRSRRIAEPGAGARIAAWPVLAFALAVAAGACQAEDVAPFVPTPGLGQRVDFFVQVAQLDVLFVVDNSGSMVEEQASLARSFNRFIANLERFGVDYHVGVVSTDVEEPSHSGRLQGSPPFITRQTRGRDAAFRRNVDVGTDGSGLEQGLLAAVLALSGELTRARNRDFLRPLAPLTLIFVSDEDDGSPGPDGYYTRVLRGARGIGNDRIIRASAIVGLPGRRCGAVSDEGRRYLEVVAALGGAAHDLCDQDFGDALEDIGSNALEALRRFPLSCTPAAPGSVRVVVDGVELAEEWVFEATSDTVVFDGPYVPPADASLEIGYDVVPEACP